MTLSTYLNLGEHPEEFQKRLLALVQQDESLVDELVVSTAFRNTYDNDSTYYKPTFTNMKRGFGQQLVILAEFRIREYSDDELYNEIVESHKAQDRAAAEAEREKLIAKREKLEAQLAAVEAKLAD